MIRQEVTAGLSVAWAGRGGHQAGRSSASAESLMSARDRARLNNSKIERALPTVWAGEKIKLNTLKI